MYQEESFREDVAKMMDAYQSGVDEGKPLGHLDLNVYSTLRDFTFDHAGEGSTDAKLAKAIQDIEATRGVPFEHIPRALIQAIPDDEPMKQALVDRQNVSTAQSAIPGKAAPAAPVKNDSVAEAAEGVHPTKGGIFGSIAHEANKFIHAKEIKQEHLKDMDLKYHDVVEKMMDEYQSGMKDGEPVSYLEMVAYGNLRRLQDYYIDKSLSGFVSNDDVFGNLAKTVHDIEAARGEPFKYIPKSLIDAIPDEDIRAGLFKKRYDMSTALPAAPKVASAAPVKNASISLREGVQPRETDMTTKMADMKLDMACDALSKIQDVPKGLEGERVVGAMLLRVKDSVNDRLYGRAGMDNPPSKNEAFGIMLQVKDAFTAGAKGAGHQFAAAFKETLDSITTQVGTFMAATQIKQESSKNQDLNAG